MLTLYRQSWALLRRYLINRIRSPIVTVGRVIALPLLVYIIAYTIVKGADKSGLFLGLAMMPLFLQIILFNHTHHYCDWIIADKASGIKELMTSMGLKLTSYYVGTLSTMLPIIFTSSLVLHLVLKLSTDSDYPVAEPIAMLLLFSLQLCALIFLLSSFISSNKFNLIIVILLLANMIFSTLVLPFLERRYNNIMEDQSIYLAFISPYLSFRDYLRTYLSQFDQEEDKFYIDFLLPTVIKAKSKTEIIVTMLVATISQFSFAIWFEQVCPWRAVSAPLHPLFCCRYFVKGKESKTIDNHEMETMMKSQISKPEYFETRPNNLPIGIKLVSISKAFDSVFAVDNVTLPVFRGETTLLLGHNGAGKTTLMNLILGKLIADSGYVKFSQDSKTLGTGVCPQESILDVNLTVYQHMELFIDIKAPHFTSSQRRQNIQQVLSDVRLITETRKLPTELSGGMRRKLSLGMAFIGDSSVLILDEPSSGLDPDSRMMIWDAIRKYRTNHTVLLSTQHMEEADYLGDRVVIMSSGRIVCYGSSVFLKKLFGGGYKLRIECKASRQNQVLEFVKHFFPSAKLSNNDQINVTSSKTGSSRKSSDSPAFKSIISIIVNLPQTDQSQDYEKDLIRLLEAIEKAVKSPDHTQGILGHSLRSSGMEDVLLNTSKTLAMGTTGQHAVEVDLSNAQIDTMSRVVHNKSAARGHILYALIMKRIRTHQHDWLSTIAFQIVVPIFCIWYLLYGWRQSIRSIAGPESAPSFIACLLYARFVYYPTNERVSKFKIMQLTSQANIWLYWASFFIVDLVFMIFIVIAFNIVMPLTFDLNDLYPSVTNITMLAHLIGSSILILFGLASTMVAYLLSHLFKEDSSSVGKLLMIYVSATFVSQPLRLFRLRPIAYESIKMIVCAIFPTEALGSILIGLAMYPDKVDETAIIPRVTLGFGCLAMQTLAYSALLVLVETNAWDISGSLDPRRWCRFLSGSSQRDRPPGDFQPDDDVIAESTKAANLIARVPENEFSLVASKLDKSYVRGVKVIDKLAFTINRSECFGLLGVNGAGKSTTFSMLVAESQPDTGRIWACKRYSDQDLQLYRSNFGYDPQSNPTMSISPYEALSLMARLRLVKEEQIDRVVGATLDLLDMSQHSRKSVAKLSGGTKRKLALGMSLIGNPALLALDEPTAGVDPMARRSVWQLLRALRDRNDMSVIISSHAMEECEAICDRIGIMASGKLRCLGTFFRLSEKFAQGCSVRLAFGESADSDALVSNLGKHLCAQLGPAVKLSDKSVTSATFEVKAPNIERSNIFKSLREFRNKHPQVSYILNDFSLEDVFKNLAKEQHSPS